MTFADPIGDMLTRIRNAQMRLSTKVEIPSSKFREKILDILKQEGYIADYKLLSDSNKISSLSVDLKYHNGAPVIKEINWETMAKTSSIQRNLKIIRLVNKFSKKRKKLKKIIKNKKLPLDERFNAQLKLAKLPRNSAKIRIRNRCEMTGRPRGVYRKLKISRIALRELASKGKIPGMTKSSW